VGHFSIGSLPDAILWVRRDGEERNNAGTFGLRLRIQGVIGSVTFYDTQMDEQSLGNWVREKSITAGTEIFEEERVERFIDNGDIEPLKFGRRQYGFIVNAVGP